MRITKKQLEQFDTIKLADVTASFKWGNPPQAGWLAALDKDGKVVMSAGRPAWGIFFANAGGNGYEVRRIVD